MRQACGGDLNAHNQLTQDLAKLTESEAARSKWILSMPRERNGWTVPCRPWESYVLLVVLRQLAFFLDYFFSSIPKGRWRTGVYGSKASYEISMFGAMLGSPNGVAKS